jgi:long-chain fatty acid transport protein
VSLGTEYRSGANAYRCGIFWDQSPIPDETFSPTFPDINDKLSFNGGFGHDFGQWTLDLNMQYVAFSEREIKSQSFVDNNKNGVYNAISLSGNIGLTYKF